MQTLTLWCIASAMAMVACGQPIETRNRGQHCETDRDCGKGLVCTAPAASGSAVTAPAEHDKTCQIPCRADVDCPEGLVCLGRNESPTGLCSEPENSDGQGQEVR